MVNLENCKTCIKLMFTYLKAHHVDLCLDFFRLYPLQNFGLVGSETQTRLHMSAGSPDHICPFIVIKIIEKISLKI